MDLKERLATGAIALVVGSGFFAAGYSLAPSTKTLSAKTKEIANLTCQNRIVTDQYMEQVNHHIAFVSRLPKYDQYAWSDGSVSKVDEEKMIKEINSRYKW